MDFHLSPSSSSSSSHHRNPNNNSASNGHSSDPMHSWWESISRARSRIHLLSSLLPSSTADSDEDPLSSLADTDRPARSLLLSSAAYSSLFAAICAPSSGAANDPICQWLYDTYLSSDPDLRLVVLSYLPLIASVYLHRIHHPASDAPVSLSGFEAVLLAVYTSEAKARNGKVSHPLAHDRIFRARMCRCRCPTQRPAHFFPHQHSCFPPKLTWMTLTLVFEVIRVCILP